MKKPPPTPENSLNHGIFIKEESHSYVRLKTGGQIYIHPGKDKQAVPGQIVLVRTWAKGSGLKGQGRSRRFQEQGEILQILGHKDDPGVDIKAIAAALGMPFEFHEEVMTEAAAVYDKVRPEDIHGRRDLRSQHAITIDGSDAKDLDDAVFLEALDKGCRLYVHIADVAHYVPLGGPMDKEAYARGTSAYLADRVIPMLPHALSNGICSLNAGADRLALTVVMDINHIGIVTSSQIMESVIHVKDRMTYDMVYELLTDPNSPNLKTYAFLMPMLVQMEELSVILKENRRARGAIELSSSECKFTLDDKGRPIDITRREQNLATSIIEEFMILCNETVAREIKKGPFLYRTHEPSEPEKLNRLFDVAQVLGLTKPAGRKKGGKPPKARKKSKPSKKKHSSKAVLDLLDKARGTQYEEALNRTTLSIMQQAKYSHRNTGHYGLASDCYCHFTSPIRRYPDLFCHRVIKALLKGSLGDQPPLKNPLPETAMHLSAAERRALTAEREVESLKKAQFMTDKMGQRFKGRISGITNYGFYVELPNTVEGLVTFSSLRDGRMDDFFTVDESRCRAMGRRSKKAFTLGDKVQVCLVNVDPERGHIDFALVK